MVGAPSLRASAAAALLGALLLSSPARAQDPAPALTVQRAWRLLAIGLDTDPRLRVRALLGDAERGLRRELPGLDIRFDVERWRRLVGPRQDPPGGDAGLVRAALALAERGGLELASYDVVFVLSPRFREPYFGGSHIDWADARGRAVRAALVQSAPFDLVHRGLLDALAGRQVAPGFDRAPGIDLPPGARDALLRALEGNREPLRRLFELPVVREALLLPTLAHELGHFFAPGDLDIRDGYSRPWLRHSTGPEDDPEGHGVECVMYKGRSAMFYVQKALATRGRLVVFCDACRAKLGCPPRDAAGGAR